jgi:hypothetical protein
MTLLVTEVWAVDGLRKTRIFVAADRRLSKPGGQYAGTRKKLFEVRRLGAAIGYFGLAVFTVGTRVTCFSDWLPSFIAKATATTLAGLAQELSDELNRLVPSQLRRRSISGFHLTGHNVHGLPEMWYVRNVEDDAVTLTGRYDVREEFMRVGAAAIGYDGQNPTSARSGQGVFYRSGDIRAHVAAWETLDVGFGKLRADPAFITLKKAEDYREWVKFRMEVIAYFYKRFARQQLVARPIDVLQLEGKSG